jgi:hypothetical protein
MTTDEGSVVIELLLQEVWGPIAKALSSETADALDHLYVVLFAATTGVIALIKRFKGKQPVEKTPSGPGSTTVTAPDGSHLEVPNEVLQLYDDVEIRLDAHRIVAILKRDGIDSLFIGKDAGPPPTVISKEEAPAFDRLPGGDVILADFEHEMAVEVEAVDFRRGSGWRFTDGERSYEMKIDDAEFRKRVANAHETFAAGDLFRCVVRTTQTLGPKGLRVSHRITRVIERLNDLHRGARLRGNLS